MKRKQFIVRLFLVWFLFASLTTVVPLPKVSAQTIYPLSTVNTLFFDYFPDYRDYMLTYLNVSTFGIDHPIAYKTTEATNYQSERVSTAFFALLDTFAYEQTGDTRYLFEAKWLIDGLREKGMNANQSVIAYYKASEYAYWLYPDVAVLMAEQKLNEYGYGNYNVVNMTDFIISCANVNTSSYLGWYYLWNQHWQPQSGDGQTIDDWAFMFYLLSYLTNKGVKDYSLQLTKLKTYTYLGQRTTKNFKYAINGTNIDSAFTVIDVFTMLLGKKYSPTLLIDGQVTELINQNGTGLAYIKDTTDAWILDLAATYDIATNLGYTTVPRLRSAMALVKERFIVNNELAHTQVQELRLRFINIAKFLMVIGITQTSSDSYDTLLDGNSWKDYGQGQAWKRLTLGDVDYNSSNQGFFSVALKEAYNFGTVGLNVYRDVAGSDFTTFSYNSANKEYSATTQTLYSTVATLRHAIGGWRGNITLNGYGAIPNPDRRINFFLDYNSANTYFLYTQNETEYNMDSWTTSVKKLSTYYAIWDYKYGFVTIVKISDTNQLIYYYKTASYAFHYFNSSLSAQVWRFQVEVGSTNNLKTLVKEILSDVVSNGEFSHAFSLSLGSAKWKLNHLSSGISVYTDKNVTATAYSNNQLSYTVSAPSGTTSTTKIYAGSNGQPQSVSGASSYSYNAQTRILTVNVVHSSPQDILILWSEVPESTRTYIVTNFNAALILLGLVSLIFMAGMILLAFKQLGSFNVGMFILFMGFTFILMIAVVVINLVFVSLI